MGEKSGNLGVFIDINARLEKLNQKSSHQTFLFLQLVIQGHSNYIGAYKRLKVPRIVKNIFLRIVKMKEKNEKRKTIGSKMHCSK